MSDLEKLREKVKRLEMDFNRSYEEYDALSNEFNLNEKMEAWRRMDQTRDKYKGNLRKLKKEKRKRYLKEIRERTSGEIDGEEAYKVLTCRPTIKEMYRKIEGYEWIRNPSKVKDLILKLGRRAYKLQMFLSPSVIISVAIYLSDPLISQCRAAEVGGASPQSMRQCLRKLKVKPKPERYSKYFPSLSIEDLRTFFRKCIYRWRNCKDLEEEYKKYGFKTLGDTKEIKLSQDEKDLCLKLCNIGRRENDNI